MQLKKIFNGDKVIWLVTAFLAAISCLVVFSCSTSINTVISHIFHLIIDPDQQQNGYGKKLVHYAEELILENNFKAITLNVLKKNIESINDIPSWNYDGSSTGQAFSNDSEVIIKPRALFRSSYNNYIPYLFNQNHIFVLCDTYKVDGTPHPTNKRELANNIFNQKLDQEPWYGLEQEYFIMSEKNPFDHSYIPLGYMGAEKQGQYYCSVGSENAFGRIVAETHMRMCLDIGINISGINAEVAPGQWEFQVGPCVGIEAGDHLWMARYILKRIAESFNYSICFEPKPLKGNWNGSGCHTNYSTKLMREGNKETGETGIHYINEAIKKLSLSHDNHMLVYGSGNKSRMTGLH